jgi:hypothetical protein
VVEQYQRGNLERFGKSFVKGHGSTNYPLWMSQDQPYQINYVVVSLESGLVDWWVDVGVWHEAECGLCTLCPAETCALAGLASCRANQCPCDTALASQCSRQQAIVE